MNDTFLDFINLQCEPRPNGETPIQTEAAKQHLHTLKNNWLLSENGNSISRVFKFKNYYETIAFMNAAALVAHQQDHHHPEITVSYNTCHIQYSTHSVGGLSINDFICAAKTDRMLRL